MRPAMTNGAGRQFLNAARKRELAELAEAVAEEHCPAQKVMPEQIAVAKRITVSFGSYANAFDGLLEHKGGRFHIYCNLDRVANRASARARFTLAHELGHFYIDEHRNALKAGRVPSHGSFCEYESKNPAEQEADHFASNLLMPSERFLRQAKSSPIGLATIMSLANRFGTSITSTAVRYADLSIKPSVVVKWTAKGQFSWKWLSYETREAGFRKTVESMFAVLEGSATAKALTGAPEPVSGFFQTGTTAAAWFPHVKKGTYQNVILIEQAIRLGRFGVLTFLYPEQSTFPWVM